MNILPCKTLRAVFIEADKSKPAINYSPEKELVDAYNIVVNYRGQLREVVTVRCYMGRSSSASVVHASVWIYCNDGTFRSGRGSAGGYGYCKRSAAIGAALRAAGVCLFGTPYSCRDETVDMKTSFYMDGTGTSMLDVILASVARAAGYRGAMTMIHN